MMRPFAKFWKERISEHFELQTRMLGLSILNSESNAKSIQTLAAAWNDTKTEPDIVSIIPSLIEHNIMLQKQLATESCFYDLLTHMSEETQELQLMIVVGCKSKAHMLQRWAMEHKEDNDFLICQLPKFVASPEDVQEPLIKAQQLSQQFNEFLSGKSFFVDKFLILSDQHIAGLKEMARSTLPRLTMSDTSKQFLNYLLEHELREAEWAHRYFVVKFLQNN